MRAVHRGKQPDIHKLSEDCEFLHLFADVALGYENKRVVAFFRLIAYKMIVRGCALHIDDCGIFWGNLFGCAGQQPPSMPGWREIYSVSILAPRLGRPLLTLGLP